MYVQNLLSTNIWFTNYNEIIRKSDQENTFQLPFSFNVIDSDLRRYPQSLVTIIGLLNDKYYQIINALARLWPLELSRVQKAQGSSFSRGLLYINYAMSCLNNLIIWLECHYLGVDPASRTTTINILVS